MKTLLVGDISPKPARSYVRLEGENTVYTVMTSSVDAFRQDAFNCLSRTVISQPAQNVYPKIEKITLRIDRADLDYDIYYLNMT